MATKRKPTAGKIWRQKLEQDHPSHGKLVAIPPKMQPRFGHGTLLIPRPRDIDALMRKVRKGSLMTMSQLRRQLADAAGATHACPLTTGIFVRIVAEAAEEDLCAGRQRVTPYWRTIRDDGKLNEKYPGGGAMQAERLRGEGFELGPGRGKQPPRVLEFERHLIRVDAD